MRFLGIDSNTRGLGFGVLESGDKLIDWGIKHLSHKQVGSDIEVNVKEQLAKKLAIVDSLIERYDPDAIVIEDWTAKDSRRAPSVKKLLCRIEKLAAKRKIKFYSFSMTALFGAFVEYDIKTKYELAVFLGKYFRELESRVPRPRKAWMSESVWLSMFKAVAFCFVQKEKTPN